MLSYLYNSEACRFGGMNGKLPRSAQMGAMFSGQAVFGLWCIVAASVTALMKFLEKQNAICLREILFNHALKQYLSGENRFYHQRLTDPAARMTRKILLSLQKNRFTLLGMF